MGHYSESYEFDQDQILEKRNKRAKKTIVKFVEKSSLDQIEFIANIVENIEDYQAFFRVIKKQFEQ